MATASNQQFGNVRDAFCARHRCTPAEFERKLFFRTLHPFRSLLALPIWWFNRNLFAIDLDLIQGVGRCSRKEECESLIEEFYNANQVERGFRRGMLSIRVSGTRVMEVWDQLSASILPPEAVDPLAGAVISAGSSALSPKGASVVALRKLKQLHEAVTQGEPLEAVLSEAGLTREQFLEQLELNRASNAGFGWLRDQLEKERRLDRAEQMVTDLNQLTATQSLELAELRRRAGG
ncbi:MAG TPA: hypothetical protein VMB21_00700 [Candidatus Limnocylindria bacterium]|jgi:hypothetical protein|nr:hypothetical protein [Candidatus Limnocylindria bacterium]